MGKGNLYVAKGVRTDCKTLIDRFEQQDTLRYHSFIEIWRDMKFPYIFFGRQTYEELVELTEEILRIAKEFWLESTKINTQTGGLYTLYGVYIKQPADIRIRITPEDLTKIMKYQNEIRKDHHDANYILARLFAIGAFHFCATVYQYGLELPCRKYLEYDRSLKELGHKPKYATKLTNHLFSELCNALTAYHEAKCKLEGPRSRQPPELLNYVDKSFGNELRKSFQRIILSSTCETEENDVKKESSSDIMVPWWLQDKDTSDEQSSSEEEEITNECNITSERDGRQLKKDLAIRNLGMPDVDDDIDSDSDDNSEAAGASCSFDMPAL